MLQGDVSMYILYEAKNLAYPAKNPLTFYYKKLPTSVQGDK